MSGIISSGLKTMKATKYPNVLVVSGLDLEGGDEGVNSSVYTPYLLALRMELSYDWNVSASFLRKSGCWQT
jgi:hypothetical protein